MKQLEIIQSNLQTYNDVANAATPQEAINLMESFEGWGRCRNLIDSKSEESQLLAKYMGRDILPEVQEATLTSFFTPQPVADTIMSIVQILYMSFVDNGISGFPKILDPSAGAGAFTVAARKIFYKSLIWAYEKDSFARSLMVNNKALRNHVFHEVDFVDGICKPFNIIASNIPFGNMTVRPSDNNFTHDPDINRLACKSIHSFYFAKASSLLLPHGLIAFITSRSFLEAPAWQPLRTALIDEGMRVISMVRLPDNLFPTVDVGTDLIILTKTTPEECMPTSQSDELFKDGVQPTYGSDEIFPYFPLVGHEPHNGKIKNNQFGKPSYQFQNNVMNLLPDLIYQTFSASTFSALSQRKDIFNLSLSNRIILGRYDEARFSSPFISKENKCRHDKIIRNNSKKYQDNYAKSSQTTTQAKN